MASKSFGCTMDEVFFVSAIEAALPLLNVGFYKHAENRQDDTTKPLVHFHMGENDPRLRRASTRQMDQFYGL